MSATGRDTASPSRWHLTDTARTALTRVALLVLLVAAVDGALTWYVTDEAASVVDDIEARDGVVIVDDSEEGAMHRTEIDRAVGDNDSRIRLGAVKWIPAVAFALVAGLLSSRADPVLRRSVVMGVALTLAIWVAPRVLYSRELPVLHAVFG